MYPDIIHKARKDVDLEKIAGSAAWALPLLSTGVGALGGGMIGAAHGKAGKGALMGGLLGAGVGAAGLGIRGLGHQLKLTEAGKNLKALGVKSKGLKGLKSDFSGDAAKRIANLAARKSMGKGVSIGGNADFINRAIRQGMSKSDIINALRKQKLLSATAGLNPKQIAMAGGGLYLGGKYLGKENTKVNI